MMIMTKTAHVSIFKILLTGCRQIFAYQHIARQCAELLICKTTTNASCFSNNWASCLAYAVHWSYRFSVLLTVFTASLSYVALCVYIHPVMMSWSKWL